MDKVQPSQLDALRQLLTNESLLNGLLGTLSGVDGGLSTQLNNTQRGSEAARLKVGVKPKRKPGAPRTKTTKTTTTAPMTRVQKGKTKGPCNSIARERSDMFQDRFATSKFGTSFSQTLHPKSILQPEHNSISTTLGTQRSPLFSALTGKGNANNQGFDEEPEVGIKKFIVGLDYGTTFTTVSYYSHPIDDEHPRAFPSDLRSIMNWSFDGNGGVRKQLPTESWYSARPRQRAAPREQFDEEEDIGSEVEGHLNLDPHINNYQHEFSAPEDVNNSNGGDGELNEYLWGYHVPYQKYRVSTSRDEMLRMERPKLMLVSHKEAHTQEDRAKIRPCLDHLIAEGIIHKYGKKNESDIRDVQDVVTDFLIKVFTHTKQQLIENESFTEESPVEFVLAVPARWSPMASRVLQFAVEAAIRATGFGTLSHGGVENLFIITEPEAAATYLLGGSHDMLAGETFVVLDCGGGTVDGVTYTITSGYPLQLNIEVGRPNGDNCGASYLNDNFEKRVLERLKSETYLERNGETLESIVRHLVPLFEDYDKRRQDIYKRPANRMKIHGLQGDSRRGLSGPSAKRFDDNFILLNTEDYNEIFLPLLQRVSAVLREQLEGAIFGGKDVKKVFLIGGFGAAPSLRSFLSRFLVDFARESKLMYAINLITRNEQESVTAIASGAVLRALNKDHGPRRLAYSSYGFLRQEPFQPDVIEAHRGIEPRRDEVDGEEYVTAIDYFLVKGTIILPTHYFKPFKTRHIFEVDNERLLCEEVLYVSDFATESHYVLDHPKNRDVQVAGKIISDMTFLKNDGIILPVFPEVHDDGILRGKVHYEVEYELIAIVEGRNLKYEARYPADHTGTAQKTRQISIAAAFRPGTG